jgi:hypothetical protein
MNSLMLRFFLISAVFCLVICCKKANTNPTFSGTGVLTGSDTTCGGWGIKTSNNTVLDPLNIDTFSVTKKDGQAVTFTYHNKNEQISICLIGQPIELVTIQDQ